MGFITGEGLSGFGTILLWSKSGNCCCGNRCATVGVPGTGALQQKRGPDKLLKDHVGPSLQLMMVLFC